MAADRLPALSIGGDCPPDRQLCVRFVYHLFVFPLRFQLPSGKYPTFLSMTSNSDGNLPYTRYVCPDPCCRDHDNVTHQWGFV